jgi:hypothetical protein
VGRDIPYQEKAVSGIIEDGPRNDRDIVSAVDLTPTLLEGKSQDNRDYTVGYYYRNLRQDNMFPESGIQRRINNFVYGMEKENAIKQIAEIIELKKKNKK